jgi:uncharacterized protein (TIGR02246 family)
MNTNNAVSTVLVMTIVFLSLSGCDGPESGSSEDPMKTENTEDIAAVKKLAEDYTAAWAKGDPEILLACYADDAVVIMSYEEPIVGKEALRELYEHVFAAQKTEEEGGGEASMAEAIGLNPDDYTWTTEGDGGKPEVSGDLGYLWSTYASVATPKPGVDAEPIRDSGASLLIVRRQEDGAWKVALKMDTRGEKPEAANEQNETGQ